MATIKTIDFSTKPICPECGREIPTDEIDVEKDRAWCPNCRREMSFGTIGDRPCVSPRYFQISVDSLRLRDLCREEQSEQSGTATVFE